VKLTKLHGASHFIFRAFYKCGYSLLYGVCCLFAWKRSGILRMDTERWVDCVAYRRSKDVDIWLAWQSHQASIEGAAACVHRGPGGFQLPLSWSAANRHNLHVYEMLTHHGPRTLDRHTSVGPCQILNIGHLPPDTRPHKKLPSLTSAPDLTLTLTGADVRDGSFRGGRCGVMKACGSCHLERSARPHPHRG